MHQPIKDNLEEYLKGTARTIPQDFQAHVEACGDCAGELRMLESQSEMLRSLRADADVEPRAGFYARVMDRIERQGQSSIWSILLQPAFGRRLAVASAALVLLLGTYLVTTERNAEPEVATSSDIVLTGPAEANPAYAQDSVQQQRDRDAVLVDLAGYRQ